MPKNGVSGRAEGGVMDYMKRKNCENEYEKQVRKIIFIER